jgi:hypothetical protein
MADLLGFAEIRPGKSCRGLCRILPGMRKDIPSATGLGYKYRQPPLSSGKERRMAKTYYVVGGEYADTSFTIIAPGQTEEQYGPFDEHEAHSRWRALTGKSVDNAMIRYFIRRSVEEATGDAWYVVGGEYADTTFQEFAAGREREVYGPFGRKDALDKWRAVTGKTVDNALCRYDLCSSNEMHRDE